MAVETLSQELDRVRRFLVSRAGLAFNPFYGPATGTDVDDEHFAALHRMEAYRPGGR